MATRIKLTESRAPTKRAVPVAVLREQIARELHIAADDLREWNTRFCPECRQHTQRRPLCAVTDTPHLPPLFYVLAPETLDGDMPLGMGDSPRAALTDLLWTLRATRLLDDLEAI